ncbi:MAG TPA: DNA primase [Gemmatimonadaceae bacterium]|nr:DNA primase [Gemmatimonadaceae bacterium]
MIPDEIVERVRESADIVAIIGEHVNLKRTGTDFRGPCPFHQGTHRNFSVSPRKGIYYCFVCHEGGDVFTFLQRRLGMDWPTAVRQVAARVGIDVPEVNTRREGPDPREPLWEVNASAAEYFRAMLWGEDLGEEARNYLSLRRVTREVADQFGLGFAPRDPEALRTHLNAIGFSDERLLESGLLLRREDSEELRSRFRNRLIFPIQDPAGHHVGFGGRLLGPGEPKYLNSAESPTFSKARMLYGLNWAKHAIRREDRVLVVEGYFDVVRLVSHGVEAVVAPLGTALTEAQAAILRRYTKNAYLLYDSDRAGLKATFRAGDELLRHGMAVQVVTLPEGEDPDSFVDKHGSDQLLSQLGKAIDVFERKLQLLERAGWFGDLQRKRRALDRLLPTIRATTDALTRDMYLTRTSEVAGVSKALLEREVDSKTAVRRGGEPELDPVPHRTRDRRRGDRRTEIPAGTRYEREIIWVLVHERSRVEGIAEQIGADDLTDPLSREIYSLLLESESDDVLDPTGLSDAAAALLVEMQERQMGEGFDIDSALRDGVARIRGTSIEERLAEIDDVLMLADDAQKNALISEKMKLNRSLKELGVIRVKGTRQRRKS